MGHGVGAEIAGHGETTAGLEKDAIRATVDMAVPHFILHHGGVMRADDGKPPRSEIDLDQGAPGESTFYSTANAC